MHSYFCRAGIWPIGLSLDLLRCRCSGVIWSSMSLTMPQTTSSLVGNQAELCQCRCAFSNCQHVQEPGCCVRADFSRHPIYVELYHEVKQQEDLERHRSMSKKVAHNAPNYAHPEKTWVCGLATVRHGYGFSFILHHATQDTMILMLDRMALI